MLATLPVASTFSYVQSESTQRVPIRWARPSATLAIDSSGVQDVSPALATSIFATSLGHWASSVPFSLQPVAAGQNQLSYSSDARYFGPGVVAVTMLSYAPGDGRITGGSILMNQTAFRAFCFTADPAATPCTAPGRFWDTPIFLGDVISHELGHFMGLGHSEVRDATMLFSAFRGQSTPHADDVAGVRHIYARAQSGSISGTVQGGSAVGVFGAHVQAISLRTGKVAAAALSDESGAFRIHGLDLEDSYHLYVEPLRRLDALPDAYRSFKASFCPGNFVGSFFEACSGNGRGKPQRISLTSARPSRDVGVVSIRCQLRVGEEYMAAKLNEKRGRYEFLATPAEPERSFVGLYFAKDELRTDVFDETVADEVRIDLRGLPVPLAGHQLELSLLTTSLGSALDLSVSIAGPFGTVRDPDRLVLDGVPQPAREPGTQKRIYERRWSYPLSATAGQNVFVVKLSPRALTTNETLRDMASFENFGIRDRPWLLQTRIVSGGVARFLETAPVVQDNRSCLDAPFTFAVKANGVAAATLDGRSEEAGGEEAKSQAVACGTVGAPPSGGGGTLVVLALGFLCAFLGPRRSAIS